MLQCAPLKPGGVECEIGGSAQQAQRRRHLLRCALPEAQPSSQVQPGDQQADRPQRNAALHRRHPTAMYLAGVAAGRGGRGWHKALPWPAPAPRPQRDCEAAADPTACVQGATEADGGGASALPPPAPPTGTAAPPPPQPSPPPVVQAEVRQQQQQQRRDACGSAARLEDSHSCLITALHRRGLLDSGDLDAAAIESVRELFAKAGQVAVSDLVAAQAQQLNRASCLDSSSALIHHLHHIRLWNYCLDHQQLLQGDPQLCALFACEGEGKGEGGRGECRHVLVEALRPGLAAAHPHTWGALLRCVERGEDADVEELLAAALLGLKLIAAVELPLRLVRLSYCCCAGAAFARDRIKGTACGSHSVEERESTAHGSAVSLFLTLAFVPDLPLLRGGRGLPAVAPPGRAREDAEHQCFLAEQLSLTVAHYQSAEFFCSALAACLHVEWRAQQHLWDRAEARRQQEGLRAHAAAEGLSTAQRQQQEPQQQRNQQPPRPPPPQQQDALRGLLDGVGLGEGRAQLDSDHGVIALLAQLMSIMSGGRCVDGAEGQQQPPSVPELAVLLCDPARTALLLLFLHTCWKTLGGKACIVFQPTAEGATAAAAAPGPGRKAAQHRQGPKPSTHASARCAPGSGAVVLRHMQAGVLPVRTDPQYANAFDWGQMYCCMPHVNAGTKWQEGLKPLRVAMLQRRLGAAWLEAEGVEGVQRALAMAEQVGVLRPGLLTCSPALLPYVVTRQIRQEMLEQGMDMCVAVAHVGWEGVNGRVEQEKEEQRAAAAASPAAPGAEPLTPASSGHGAAGDDGRGARVVKQLEDTEACELVGLICSQLQEILQGGPSGRAGGGGPGQGQRRSIAAVDSLMHLIVSTLGERLARQRGPVREGVRLQLRLMQCEPGRPERLVVPAVAPAAVIGKRRMAAIMMRAA
ncbi:hypothetical protein TSOC_001308 [Tetrabaena socialis]|uniref:Uncharacterized protein n=1 Tax=Tetrabaena socialis TaxID=47790 RepID=A0A2J8AH08_9CHLO|nr:hypothetical protein TSOC_001308 [Tetrabaena socialis]|eukprot:PNH11809.1 hypothetical protein TSOC_001308 [Tetrabaena socialis]